jgi:N-glycosyltransferase
MKILFTLQPTTGHFHSMVPLAMALQEQGHEIAFATGASFGPVVQRSSFLHIPCGFDFDGSGDICAALPEWESLQARFPGSTAIQQMYSFVEGLAPRMVKDLVPIIDAWKPDLIIRDPMEFGGYIAAELAGLPQVPITWAIYIPAQFICPEALDALRRQVGLPSDPELKTLDRFLVLNFLPPAWAFPGSPVEHVTHRFCAPPFDRSAGEGLPGWMDTLPERPTVQVTLGTTFNRSPACSGRSWRARHGRDQRHRDRRRSLTRPNSSWRPAG